MNNRNYWKEYYVVETDADRIERKIKSRSFVCEGRKFELMYFQRGKKAPNILISQGSGGHALVFAELGFQMYLAGYNVFIMPKHGGYTIDDLMARHSSALRHITSHFNERIGVFAEGLGGFVVFYLALAHGPMKSAVYQNAPAILVEKKFKEAMTRGKGAARRRRLMLPFIRFVPAVLSGIRIPLRLYLDFVELIDTKEENRRIENRLVRDGYMNDPDFDTRYPLSAVKSLVLTPPPRPLSDLKTPTMFLAAARGWSDPSYVRDLYDRLPHIKKELVEIDGSVFWMLSHPKEAARVICEWFEETV